jgi:hypothetical protein
MKRKMVIVAMVGFFLASQTAFGQLNNPNELQFLEFFKQSDLQSMERVLREHRNNMDLNALLGTVIIQYAWGVSDWLTPLNTNRNIALDVIQMFARVGIDFNRSAPYYYEFKDARIRAEDYYFKDLSLLQIVIQDYRNPDLRIIRALLENGVDLYRISEGYTSQSNKNPFLFPISDDNLALARLLIEYNYNVNRPVSYRGVSDTLLSIASSRGQIGLVRLLVESGAMVNRQSSSGITPAQLAYNRGEIDIYNYLKANGATWTAPSQVASAPPSSSNTYTPPTPSYTPPPSSSSSSSTPDRNVGREIAEAFRSPLQSGTYSLAGTQARIRLTSIAKSGIFTYTNRQGRTGTGQYSIDGNRMTIQMEEYTFLYTVDSQTSFSGNGETWVRTGL